MTLTFTSNQERTLTMTLTFTANQENLDHDLDFYLWSGETWPWSWLLPLTRRKPWPWPWPVWRTRRGGGAEQRREGHLHASHHLWSAPPAPLSLTLRWKARRILEEETETKVVIASTVNPISLLFSVQFALVSYSIILQGEKYSTIHCKNCLVYYRQN